MPHNSTEAAPDKSGPDNNQNTASVQKTVPSPFRKPRLTDALTDPRAYSRVVSFLADYAATLTEEGQAKVRTSIESAYLDDFDTALLIAADRAREGTCGQTSRTIDGAAFILDLPDTQPAIWGRGSDILWAAGQACMICGGNGVGKTTLSGQLLRGRLGLTDTVLGYPVEAGAKRVLYLACDRPSQIARSLARQFSSDERAVLRERLAVHKGPPPYDFAKRPEILVAMCREAEADTVFVDSLKDVAVGLASDEVAAGYNRARQLAIAEGIEVVEDHHQVKRSASGGRPEGIEDVYGGAFLTGGAGSVILLCGDPGDPVVRLKHLKPVQDTVGPFTVEHDHDRGVSRIVDEVDLVTLARLQGTAGLSVRIAAQRVFDKDNPSKAEKEKARRRLDRLVKGGQLCRVETDGPSRPDTYYPNGT
ncbi:AAA family ATPase [Streptomyces sp. DG2A-72]|uniref:AAA family ATPase n=1 Tax=Streptomyces sp. DG2A-72 TaxID=3051386 RepID=UPI00265B72AF|nr:AAA family ATPase [Streptomyces sp. DG2A-72]MDO0931323.1 AAA family ATPase [Streptomyces sp. DG2A-72]